MSVVSVSPFASANWTFKTIALRYGWGAFGTLPTCASPKSSAATRMPVQVAAVYAVVELGGEVSPGQLRLHLVQRCGHVCRRHCVPLSFRYFTDRCSVTDH